MKKKTKIYGTLTVLITGLTFVTLLQTGVSYADDKHQEIKAGSIRVHQQESAYPALAKITLEQAGDAALSTVKGEIVKIQLEDENNFLVYGIEVVAPDKSIADVKIDAGNGEVLLVERNSQIDDEGRNDSNDNDQEDGNHEDGDHEDGEQG